MGLSVLLALLGWLVALHALGIGARLPGLLLVFRRAPQWLAIPFAAAGAAALAGAAMRLPPPQALGCLALGLAASLPIGLLAPALRPLRPDAPFLPPGPPDGRWSARDLILPGHPAAGAVLLTPRRLRGDGATVLIGHGGGNDRVYGLWPLLPELLARGFRVVLAHLPGHGAGGEDFYSTAAARARLDALIEMARGPLSCERILLLGQSMGAAFALDALTRGAPVLGVAALSAPIELNTFRETLREIGSFGHLAMYRALGYGAAPELLPAVGPFRRERFPVRLEADLSDYLRAFAATVRTLDLERRLPELGDAGPPMLFVHGCADSITPIAPVERTSAALRGRARTLFVPGMHHLDPLFRPAVVAALAQWLEEVAETVRA